MQQTEALSVRQLSLTLGGKAILKDISFSLQGGKILGVLGPNGAGKTSLLKLISGQRKSGNKVRWKNTALSEYSIQSLAQQIAVVNQINDVVFAITLEQVVRMGLLPHKSLLSKDTLQDKQTVANAIKAVGLCHKTQQEFSSLSGGEQQRGLIAKALVQRAPLLILDEPVNHLDVYYQHQILQLLHDLARQLNITVVMSLHDLNLASHYCDELCLLDNGLLEAFGEPSAVLEAKLLTRVFKTPCSVSKENGIAKVNFSPEHSQLLDLSGWKQ